jgi:hypothetical protein
MLKRGLNALAGILPWTPWPPGCDSPLTGNTLSSLSAKGRTSAGTVISLPPSYLLFVFHIQEKEFSSLKNKKKCMQPRFFKIRHSLKRTMRSANQSKRIANKTPYGTLLFSYTRWPA